MSYKIGCIQEMIDFHTECINLGYKSMTSAKTSDDIKYHLKSVEFHIDQLKQMFVKSIVPLAETLKNVPECPKRAAERQE